VSECLRKVHLAMLLRNLRKSVCVIGTGGSCMPNLHTLYHPSQTLGQGRGAHAPHRLVALFLRVFLCGETRWRYAFPLPFMPGSWAMSMRRWFHALPSPSTAM